MKGIYRHVMHESWTQAAKDTPYLNRLGVQVTDRVSLYG